MKFQSLLLGLILAAGLLTGCNDPGLLGGTIQPDGDKVNVKVDSFLITSSTIKVDSIYSKSSNGTLGQFYDPQFGEYKSDFICQFYCKEGFEFSRKPIDSKIDSVKFFVYWGSYVGDSLSPMKAEVYPVVKSLDNNYYSNIDPTKYADMKMVLGGETYTTYDVKNSKGRDSVAIALKPEIGQRIYDETIKNPSSFVNQEAFNEFFPGLYITNTYGMGSVVEIDQSILLIYYQYQDTTKASDGKDSTFVTTGVEQFRVTDEVIQMNRMSSFGLEELLQPNDEYTYLKSPAGVCTRFVIPAEDIFGKVGDRVVNNMPFSVKIMPQQDWKYAVDPSKDKNCNLLLLPEDSLNVFFEKNGTEDKTTAYLASNVNNTYDFKNIARLLKIHKEKSPNEDLRIVVVPVAVNNSTGSGTTTVRNYQKPAGFTLRKDPETMTVKVTSSKFSD